MLKDLQHSGSKAPRNGHEPLRAKSRVTAVQENCQAYRHRLHRRVLVHQRPPQGLRLHPVTARPLPREPAELWMRAPGPPDPLGRHTGTVGPRLTPSRLRCQRGRPRRPGRPCRPPAPPPMHKQHAGTTCRCTGRPPAPTFVEPPPSLTPRPRGPAATQTAATDRRQATCHAVPNGTPDDPSSRRLEDDWGPNHRRIHRHPLRCTQPNSPFRAAAPTQGTPPSGTTQHRETSVGLYPRARSRRVVRWVLATSLYGHDQQARAHTPIAVFDRRRRHGTGTSVRGGAALSPANW